MNYNSKRDYLKASYVSPSAKVIDIISEGVLCASGVDINDWEQDKDILDFN